MLGLQMPVLFGRSPEGLPRVDSSGVFPDPWQMQVYALHVGVLPRGRTVTATEARPIVDAVCARFGRRSLPVVTSELPMPAFEADERSGHGLRILFPGDEQSRLPESFLLHEVAHHLAVSVFQRETHGPLYASLLAAVHAAHFGLEYQALRTEFGEVATLPESALEVLRVRTQERPMDVKAMQQAVRGLSGANRTVVEYYDALPPARELAAQIERVYEQFQAPAMPDQGWTVYITE